MGKYEPLTKFLRDQPTERVSMTFAEIERVVGFKLPRSASEHRAWWSNNPSNSVMTKAWLEAGYQSEQVDMENRKLVFIRAAGAKSAGGSSGTGDPNAPKPRSLYGWLEGSVRTMPGVDLTEPVDPEWGKRIYGE
ncbi:MAG: hypothetical protein P8Z80_18150 [Pseudolabrys sp.]